MTVNMYQFDKKENEHLWLVSIKKSLVFYRHWNVGINIQYRTNFKPYVGSEYNKQKLYQRIDSLPRR